MVNSPPGAPPGLDVTLAGRRERKKIQTRAALERAALRLFAERGYERTTVEDIADAADVAVRTFFRYFQSKQHVLFGDVGHDVAARLRAALDARPASEPPVAAVGAALDAIDQDDAEQQRQVLDRIRLAELHPELGGAYHLVFHDLHREIAEYVAGRTGAATTDLYPQLLASAATGAVKAALCVFEATGGAGHLGELRRSGYAALTAGLGTIAGADPGHVSGADPGRARP